MGRSCLFYDDDGPEEMAMAGKSTIEWTEATWNPVTGCDRVSPGCDSCYALRLANRLKAMGSPRYQNDGNPRTSGPGFAVTCHEDLLDVPRHWRKGRMVFVNSMSDLFHPAVPFSFIERVFETMKDCPQHTFQILTKRSQRLKSVSTDLDWPNNVWMGVSVENASYRFRIDHLRQIPAAIRFLSIEPLIGRVGDIDLSGIDWVIVGGESGPASRPVSLAWVTEIRDQCVEAEVPFFFKQWGGRFAKAGGRELEGRHWDEFPEPAPVRIASA